MLYYILKLLGQASLLALVLFSLATQGCNPDRENPVKQIRGHSQFFNSVGHANGLLHGERYCFNCHGTALSGGTGFQPSCYSCHGKNWVGTGSEEVFAPEDHTVEMGGYWHNPGLYKPTKVCVTCHGANLDGNLSALTPSCFVCHGALWVK